MWTHGHTPVGYAILSPALVQLVHEIDAVFPARRKVHDGSIGDVAHSRRKSDHNPHRVHGRMLVTAVDITDWHPGGHPRDLGQMLDDFLCRTRDPRVKYLIHNGKITSRTVFPWRHRRYRGANPHRKHIHISVTDRGSMDARPWGFAAYVNASKSSQKGGVLMALSDKEQKELLDRVRHLDASVWREDMHGQKANSMGTLLVNTALRVKKLTEKLLPDLERRMSALEAKVDR